MLTVINQVMVPIMTILFGTLIGVGIAYLIVRYVTHTRLGAWVTMSVLGAAWIIFVIAVVWGSTGGSWRNEFLAFVPASEVGAPHTAKWLVETCAGDSGWVQTATIPGTLTATQTGWETALVRWQLNGALYAFRVHSRGAYLVVSPASGAADACWSEAGW